MRKKEGQKKGKSRGRPDQHVLIPHVQSPNEMTTLTGGWEMRDAFWWQGEGQSAPTHMHTATRGRHEKKREGRDSQKHQSFFHFLSSLSLSFLITIFRQTNTSWWRYSLILSIDFNDVITDHLVAVLPVGILWWWEKTRREGGHNKNKEQWKRVWLGGQMNRLPCPLVTLK